MTELQFLIDLLLNHKLPAQTKKAVAARIGQVEASYGTVPPSGIVHTPKQAPSTQRILDQMEAPELPPPTTAAAAQALQARADAIKKAVNSGPFQAKPEPGRTSPRKF